MPRRFIGNFGDEIAREELEGTPLQNPLIGPEGEPPASKPVPPHVESVADKDLLSPPAQSGPGDDMAGAS